MRLRKMTLLLAIPLAVAMLSTACGGGTATTGETPAAGGRAASSAWVGPLVKLNGTIYYLSKEPAVTPDQLDQVVGHVSRKLESETTVEDGDSNFLAAGTKLYAIDGYDPAEALAAEWQGEFVVLKPDLSPDEIRTLET